MKASEEWEWKAEVKVWEREGRTAEDGMGEGKGRMENGGREEKDGKGREEGRSAVYQRKGKVECVLTIYM